MAKRKPKYMLRLEVKGQSYAQLLNLQQQLEYWFYKSRMDKEPSTKDTIVTFDTYDLNAMKIGD